MFGAPVDDLLMGRELGTLAGLACVSPDALRCWTPIHSVAARRVRLNGREVRELDWSTRARRWCARCMADDLANSGTAGVWHRSWWDARFVGTCPIHRVSLLDRCVRCGKPPVWGRAPLSTCVCGHVLTEGGSTCSPTGSDHYLLGRLGVLNPCPHPLLDELDLVDCVPFLADAGVATDTSRRTGWRRSTTISTHLLAAGMSVLTDWPAGFRNLLDRELATHRDGARAGLGTYGPIYGRWLANLPRRQGFEEAIRVLEEHAVGNGLIAAGELLPGAGQSIGLVEAARRMGTGFDRARRLLGATGAVPRGSRRGVRSRLRTVDVDRLQETVDDLVGQTDVALLLGIGRRQVQQLGDAGVLAGLVHPDTVRGGRRYSRSATTRFVEACIASCPRRPSDAGMSLPRACQSVGVSISDAMRAILAGRLKPCGRMSTDVGRGLDRILVRPLDLAALRPVSRELSLSDFADAANLHPEAALALLRNGFVIGRREARGWSIEIGEVERFRSRFVTASSVALSTGRNVRSVARELSASNRKPILPAACCRQAIYEA